MITLERSELIKEMIRQLVVFLIAPTSKNFYKMIAIDALDVDSKAIQQINFTANLNEPGNTAIFFIIEEAKETILDFSQRTVEVL